ncbi:MAG TPA: SDR family NAD(P)-dependent oxidoreductase [Anaerolineales bacterium]|nr:SDR family NAD(P)-dependent oxidoreductase [Anaerolineales bacterium]
MSYFPPETPLSNHRKRAVIVGASRGIGADLARELVRRGYFVALLSRDEAALEALCAELNAAGENARSYVHDVTDYAAVPGLFQSILADLKRIDVLVYNAGVMPAVGFSEYHFEKNKAMIDVQLLGGMAWLGSAAVLFEKMRAGQIVGISSVAAERGRVKNPGYNASKAGFDAFLEALRNRLTRSGVHVLTVRPGPVDTELTREVGGFMMVQPDLVARDIARAMAGRAQVVYTPKRWRWIMLVVRNLPSAVFRRLNF